MLTGTWLRTEKTRYEKAAGMFVVGAVCVAIGWACNPFFVINKALWTSSYVLFTGGLALQFLSICYWLIDIQGYRRWAKPFEVFGLNAIALYVVADVIAMVLGEIKSEGLDSDRGFTSSFCFMGIADQCLTRDGDRFCSCLPGTDVDSLPQKYLPQSLIQDFIYYTDFTELTLCNLWMDSSLRLID